MFESWFPQEMTTLRKLLWFRTAWEKAGPPPTPSDPLNTFVGSIVRFFSHRALPVVKLEANFTPIQAGTGDPSPDNIRPISGHTGCEINRTGKNLLKVLYPGRTNNDVTFTTNADGTISLSGTATGSAYFTPNYGFNPNYMVKLPAGTYTLSNENASSDILCYGGIYDTFGNSLGSINRDTGSGSTFTFAEEFWFSYQIYVVNGTNVNGVTIKPQIEVGSAKTDYESYSGTTKDIDFGTTVYGGTLTVFEDGSGQIVADRVSISTTWGALTFHSDQTNTRRKDYALTETADTATGIRNLAICNIATYVGDTSDVIHFQIPNAGTTARFFLPISTPDDTPIQMAYFIASPVTIPLTPGQIQTLVGENTVWVNDSTGDITVQAYGTAIT